VRKVGDQLVDPNIETLQRFFKDEIYRDRREPHRVDRSEARAALARLEADLDALRAENEDLQTSWNGEVHQYRMQLKRAERAEARPSS
jgi:hypothetical protein